MANYTINQAQQVLDQSAPPDVGAPPGHGGSSGSSSTNSASVSGYRDRLDIQKKQWLAYHGIDFTDPNVSDEQIAVALYKGGLGGVEELTILAQAGLISSTDTSAELGIGPGGGSTAGPYGGGITEKQINDAYQRVQDGTATFADKVLLDKVASDKLLYGGGGSGSYSTSAEYLQSQQALQAARDAEAVRQFNITNPESQRVNDANILQNRAVSGGNTLDFARNLANDSYNRALDPGNYPAYLAASAGLPQGTGSPISTLLGQGATIHSPEGANPLADPRFKDLLDSEYKYGTVPDPASVATIRGIANANNGTLPQAFYDYTHTQNPNPPPAHAMGGSQILTGPVVGIPQGQLLPGQTPEFLAGEAGRERIDFTPMHAHTTDGMPVPHQHDGGHAPHEHMGPMIQYADGGSAITGVSYQHPSGDGSYTPAEGTAVSLGKALQPLGYVPPYVISQLMSGRAPTPGSIDETTLSRLPPSLRALLQAQIKSQVGNAGLLDYNFQLDQNALPGLNNGGMTSTTYSA